MPQDPLATLKKIGADVASSVREDDEVFDESKPPNRLQRISHFWSLVWRFFWANRCHVRASALAYTTLLAMVPLLAVSISVALAIFQGAGKDKLKGWIQELVVNVAPALEQATGAPISDPHTGTAVPVDDPLLFPDSPANTDALTGKTVVPSNTGPTPEKVAKKKREATIKQSEVVDNIVESIGNIKAGTIGATATAGLLFAAISLLRTIERAFNDIWGVTHGRSWFWSIVLYWAVMTLGPIILSIGVSSGYLKAAMEHATWLEGVPGISIFKSALLPICTLALGFSLFYQLMPNIKVQFKAAFVGGVVAAVLWYANNQMSVIYNTKVVTYSKIYGSLGAVPLFLVGLYFSWIILLFGAQVAYVYQNRQAYLAERQAQRVNQRGREFAALRLMADIARRFHLNLPPRAISPLANDLGVPPRLATQILQSLADGHLIVEASGNDRAYVPARPLEQITLKDIIETMRTGQGRQIHTADDSMRSLVRNEYAEITEVETARSGQTSLAELVHRAGIPDAPAPVPTVAQAVQSAEAVEKATKSTPPD
ncbi:MAG TPA: YhjD/YihY/BrkB family envelope integrity protein [Candidatus Limnocylindria bacterium]|nr:YhjD/YihY/BrkB family envelope integrity protein [Candidatus Limnocylindria bacterium]